MYSYVISIRFGQIKIFFDLVCFFDGFLKVVVIVRTYHKFMTRPNTQNINI